MKKILLFLSINIYIFSSSALYSENYLSCELFGQLGNQMFEIANALGVAWDNDLTPVFPQLQENDDCRIPFNYENIFFRLETRVNTTGTLLTLDGPSFVYSPVKIPPNTDIHLKGWSPSYKYFDQYRDRIQKIFRPKQEIIDRMEEKYYEVLQHPKTVGVHIRTYHPSMQVIGMPFLGKKYFIKAMNLFEKDALFVIFSDRIEWCKENFSNLNRNVIFIEDNNHIEDLYLLSKCKHQIISNSTFSWWAAYLNQNPHKKVVAPGSWYNKRWQVPENEINYPEAYGDMFYPHDWLVLSNNVPHKPNWGLLRYSSSSIGVEITD